MTTSSRENAEVQTNTHGLDTKGLIDNEKGCKNIKSNYKIKLKCKLVPFL